MMSAFRKWVDRVRGNGEYAITLPPMDGVLQPNNLIEQASCIAHSEEPDNIVACAGTLLFSSGSTLLQIVQSETKIIEDFGEQITAIAADENAKLAIATESGRILLRGPDGMPAGTDLRLPHLDCITAMAFDGSGDLLVCQGSDMHSAAHWKHDLMERNACGSVWRIDAAAGTGNRISAGLAFPNGIATDPDGAVLVSEGWRNRIVALANGGQHKVLLSDLPGFPARIVPRRQGSGWWLTIFAPRSQLIEFVLREPRFRKEMMATIDSDLWMAPSLYPPQSFLEPLQGGGLKQLGQMKPWAPTRSFGLIISLNADFQPVASWHSRADGTRHGVTSIADLGDTIIATSKGGKAIFSLPHDGGMPR